MTAHQATPSAPRQPSSAATGRPTRRAAVTGIAVALLIAAGGYGTARILGTDSPPTASPVSPSTQVTHDLQDTVIGLYGPQPARATSPSSAPRDDVRRELRETTIALYASGR
jgi:hypothetical protein